MSSSNSSYALKWLLTGLTWMSITTGLAVYYKRTFHATAQADPQPQHPQQPQSQPAPEPPRQAQTRPVSDSRFGTPDPVPSTATVLPKPDPTLAKEKWQLVETLYVSPKDRYDLGMAVGKVAVVADRLKSNVQLRVRIVAYARNDSNEVDFETDLKGLMISELKRAHGIAPSRIVSEILLNGDAGTVARKALECVIEKPK